LRAPLARTIFLVWYWVPVVPGETVVQATLTSVEDGEFVVNTGFRSVTVGVTGHLMIRWTRKAASGSRRVASCVCARFGG
jgi:hypothetical protein